VSESGLRDAVCLVTGAGGFIGSHLCDRLVEEGARVLAMSNQVSRVLPARLTHLADRVEIVEANLQDAAAVRLLAERTRPRFVFHLGAYTHVGRSFDHVDESLQTNVAGTVNLLTGLRGCDYEALVYAGTSEIYGGSGEVPFREDAAVAPLSPYAVSKYAGEQYCRMFHEAYGWPIVMVRPFNAYGPRQSPDRVIPELIVGALRGEPVAMTSGTQTREFNYVTDIADGFIRAALAGTKAHGMIVNLGCGEEHSMRQLAERISAMMDGAPAPRFGAMSHRPTEIWRMFCDNTRARDLLGWAPRRGLDDGLRLTIDFYAAEQRRGDSAYLLAPSRWSR
jgi:nucleoside-diphosphate-sugar epimerase